MLQDYFLQKFCSLEKDYMHKIKGSYPLSILQEYRGL